MKVTAELEQDGSDVEWLLLDVSTKSRVGSQERFLVPPVSLLTNKLRVKQTKKAARVTPAAF